MELNAYYFYITSRLFSSRNTGYTNPFKKLKRYFFISNPTNINFVYSGLVRRSLPSDSGFTSFFPRQDWRKIEFAFSVAKPIRANSRNLANRLKRSVLGDSTTFSFFPRRNWRKFELDFQIANHAEIGKRLEKRSRLTDPGFSFFPRRQWKEPVFRFSSLDPILTPSEIDCAREVIRGLNSVCISLTDNFQQESDSTPIETSELPKTSTGMFQEMTRTGAPQKNVSEFHPEIEDSDEFRPEVIDADASSQTGMPSSETFLLDDQAMTSNATLFQPEFSTVKSSNDSTTQPEDNKVALFPPTADITSQISLSDLEKYFSREFPENTDADTVEPMSRDSIASQHDLAQFQFLQNQAESIQDLPPSTIPSFTNPISQPNQPGKNLHFSFLFRRAVD